MNNYLIVVLNKLGPIDRKHRLTNKQIFVERRVVIIIFYIYNFYAFGSAPLCLHFHSTGETPGDQTQEMRRAQAHC